MNTTPGARPGHRRPTRHRARAGALGDGGRELDGLVVTLHEPHVRVGELRAAAVTAVHVVVPEGIDDRGAAERWQHLRPPGLPRARRARLGGARARRARRLAAAGGGGAHRPCARRPADSGWRRGAARRAGRVHRPRGTRARGAPAAAGRPRAHAARPPPAGYRGRRRCERASARSSRRPPPSSRPAYGPGAGWGSCTRCRPTGCRWPSPASRPPASRRDRGGRLAALRRGVDARQGARRVARRARDGDGPHLALRVCGQPGPRPGVRRQHPAARAERRAGRPGALPGSAHRRRAG